MKKFNANIAAADLSVFGENTADPINQSRRLPVMFLVDTSASMYLYEELLQNSVAELFQAILTDEEASAAVELGITRFDSDITTLCPIREIYRHETQGRDLDFTTTGQTLMGSALQAALDDLDERVLMYRASTPSKRYYSPILFLLTDGTPFCPYNIKDKEDETMEIVKERIRQRVSQNELVVVCIEIGDDCDRNLLTELTGLDDDRHVYKVNDATELSNFFTTASRIVISASQIGTNQLNTVSYQTMSRG